MAASHLDLVLDLNRAHATLVRRFDAELGSIHGIGLNELQLLQALAAAPGQRLRRIDLARELGLTASGVTWMLRPLAKRRILTSIADESDARVAWAQLTEAGKRLFSEALPSAKRLAEEVLAEHVSRQELPRLAQLVAALG